MFSAFSLRRVNSSGHLESDLNNGELRSRSGFSHVSRQRSAEVVSSNTGGGDRPESRKRETPSVHTVDHSLTSFGLLRHDQISTPFQYFDPILENLNKIS